MRRLALAAVLLAAPALAADPSPGSDPGLCDTLRTVNATRNKIWVTVYDAGHWRQLDHGWVDPCSVRAWRAGSYACGSYYHVRAEVKNFDLSKNVFDTQVEHNPQGLRYDTWVETLRRDGDHYYWEHGNTAGCTPTGVTACCRAGEPDAQGGAHYDPPKYAPDTVDFTFVNDLRVPVQVHLYDEYNPEIKDACVLAKSSSTWTVYGSFDYRVRATVHRKSCESADDKVLTDVAPSHTQGRKASIRMWRDEKTSRITLKQ